MAGTPGACSQVFCHPIRCISCMGMEKHTHATISPVPPPPPPPPPPHTPHTTRSLVSAANMLGSRVFCALFGAVTGQLPNSISPSLMPSSSLGSFVQVFVVTSMSVPSLVAACAAENNPDDSVGHGLCLHLVGKNDTVFDSSGSLDSCLVWCAGVKSSSMSAGALLVLGAKLIRAAASQTASAAAWKHFLKKNSAGVFTKGGSLALGMLFWVTGDHCRYSHSSSCVEARLLISLPPLCVFCRFLRCVLPWWFPWDPGVLAVFWDFGLLRVTFRRRYPYVAFFS